MFWVKKMKYMKKAFASPSRNTIEKKKRNDNS